MNKKERKKEKKHIEIGIFVLEERPDTSELKYIYDLII
jgi:hypothetical protein